MADIVIPKSIPCRFEIAWVGQCKKPSTNGWCTEHEKQKCCVCGKKATRCCDHTSSLVCGVPLCDTCQHSLNDFTHVTGKVYNQQIKHRENERLVVEQSRKSSEQRLDPAGNPANLFELLKKDPKIQGYHLEKVFFLELEHTLMGFFPAVIDREKRVIICLDRDLLVRVWKTLEPRLSKMNSQICYVNEQKMVAYVNCSEQFEREMSKPEKIMTSAEYEQIIATDPGAIQWAPGLLGGEYLNGDNFSDYVEMQALAFVSR